MNHSLQTVSYATFSQTYESHIQGRTFVENLAYYRRCKQRFWKSFQYIEALGLPPGSRVLDIGGGILAVLVSRLLKFDAIVGDVNERARKDVEDLGLKFVIVDLFSDETPEIEGLDLVILTEVIEHIPQPPYVVLGRIKKLLAPGGRLFLTTPNGHRFRNLVYMALGKEVLDIYRYPEPGMVLGHQHEYTLKQMLWQAGHAGFETEQAEYYEDGFKGASLPARIGRILAKPVGVIPYMRNGIAMTLRHPGGGERFSGNR
ncbi:methyltransferase family protein [Rhodovulum marinum]|uniref:Methyltransferase family protein n=2 Tax=Rhodovulum marinum TaxID=320662 RepID=A0A4R2PU59_9RHOB|nr:class I SAM-dependent methyltransferase [Rhodovulum marinum]TCP39573.1 methyltransferase family protein [Rhodovulum marinum]